MILVNGVWKQNKTVPTREGGELTALVTVPIMDVPVGELICKWEELVNELSDKEVDLSSKKEEYANKEFEIVFMSDIDFKAMYGSTSEKVRKEHAKNELSKLDGEIKALEFGINWIKQYIPLLKEVIRTKEKRQ